MYIGEIPGFGDNPVFVTDSDGSDFVLTGVEMKTEEITLFINGVIQRRWIDYWSLGYGVKFSEEVPVLSQIVIMGLGKKNITPELSYRSVGDASFNSSSYATQSDVEAGVSDSKIIPPSALSIVGLNKKFEIKNIPNSPTFNQSFVNRLETKPLLVIYRHRCVVAANGYVVGDLFDEGSWQVSRDISNSYGVFISATNDIITVGNGDRTFYLPDKTTGVAFQTTDGYWVTDLELYA